MHQAQLQQTSVELTALGFALRMEANVKFYKS